MRGCNLKTESGRPAPGAAGRRAIWLAGLVLFAATFALYWPAGHFDFVDYDDGDYVFNNPTVQAGLTHWGLVWSFVDAHASNWHPLTWLSHMLDCQLFGLNPGPQHWVNVLLHATNSVLLFTLWRTLTGAYWRSLLVAALFAFHPMHVESVAWISERKDVLSGFFFLLTLLAYVRETRAQSTPAVHWSLLFFLLGLLSKPMLVTVPLVLLALDWWPLERCGGGSRLDIRRLLQEKTLYFVLAALTGLIAWFAQRSSGALISTQTEGLASRVVQAFANVSHLAAKLCWPSDLCVLYLRPASPSAVWVVAGVTLVTALLVASYIQRRRLPWLGVGAGWFLVMLLPVIGLAQVGPQSIADRYSYLPSIGLFVILAWLVEEAVKRGEASARTTGQREGDVRHWSRNALPGGALGLALLCACVAATCQQLSFWRNTETLMNRALQIDPNNQIAHTDLAVYLAKHGRAAEARSHFQRAQESRPKTESR